MKVQISGHTDTYSTWWWPNVKCKIILLWILVLQALFDIEFKSTQLNGLIFFASQFSDGSGTLLSLVLRDGFVELRYNYKGSKRQNFEIFDSLKSKIFLYH